MNKLIKIENTMTSREVAGQDKQNPRIENKK